MAPRASSIEATHAIGDTARMARIVGGFNRLRDPSEIVKAVIDESMAMLGGTTATVHVLSDDGDSLDLAGLAGLPPDFEGTVYASLPVDAPLPATEVLRTGEVIEVASPADCEARYPGLGDPVPIDPSFVVVPLVDADEHPFGALAIGFADGKVLDAGRAPVARRPCGPVRAGASTAPGSPRSPSIARTA